MGGRDGLRRSRPRGLWLHAGLMLQLAACSGGESSAAGNSTNPASMPPPAQAGRASGTSGSGAGGAASAISGRGAINAGVSGTGGSVAAGSAGRAAPAQSAAGGAAVAGGSAGGTAAMGGANAAGEGGAAGATAGDGSASAAGTFTLTAVDVEMYSPTEVQFPDSSLPPSNESPGFTWSGVPAETKSLALAFTDTAGPAYKWIVWNMPPTTTGLPANMSDAPMPSEVPGASQLGSLGNQGYAGPCCPNNRYEFVLWALDVKELPDVSGMSTAQINNEILPMHEIEKTEPVKMRRR